MKRVLFVILLLVLFAVPPASATSGAAPVAPSAPMAFPFIESFSSFAGNGFAPSPASGQLDSDIWKVDGLSDDTVMDFGDTKTAAGDFARGTSTGGVTTGGIYAFQVVTGNYILGVQPAGSDFTPGDMIVRIQNETGASLSGNFSVSYKIWARNDQGYANSLNFSWSLDGTTWTSVPALDYTTAAAADSTPAWSSTDRSTIIDTTVPAAGYLYLRWLGDDVSGSGSRDEYGIDDVTVTAPTGTADPAPLVDSTTPSSGATGVAPGTDITIKFSEPVNVTDAWYAISCTLSGSHTAVTSTSDNTTFTLGPDADFTPGESCTVTLEADYITDQDINDPYDNMSSDYAWSFTVDAAPTVSSTDPGSGATDVATTANIGITFNEAVNATGTWYTISCLLSGSHTTTVSGGPTIWTLDPDADFTPGESCTVTVLAAQITDQDSVDPPNGMVSDYSWGFTVASGTVASIIINELDSDTPGTDVLEFVELYDGGVGNTSLTGKVVVFYNGNGDVSYAAYDLDGSSTDASGYFVLGNSGVAGVDYTFANGTLQNGADAVALYTGDASSFPNGTPVTTSNLVDAIVYDNGQADDSGLLVLLNSSQPQVNENSSSSGATLSNHAAPTAAAGRATRTPTYRPSPPPAPPTTASSSTAPPSRASRGAAPPPSARVGR